jgi:hypothetical protein
MNAPSEHGEFARPGPRQGVEIMRDVDPPRAVLVLQGKQWFRGTLEAWDKRDDGAWWGFVRWSGYVQWVHQDRLRPDADEP